MTKALGEDAVRTDIDALRAFCTRVFVTAGCDEENATALADNLVTADVRGTHTHGTHTVAGYARGLKAGRLNATPKPRIVKETPAMVLWDGDGTLGHLVGHRVIKDAVSRTRENGLGITLAVATNSYHLGAVGYFALQAAKHDLIGLSMSNTPRVAVPPGGRGTVVGNGPFAWGAPATSEMGATVFDVAWSVSAGSRIMLHARRGEELPHGWVVDAEGQPTTDQDAFHSGGGALVTASQHKGYGMIFLVELLTSVLGRGTRLRDIAGAEAGWCHAFLVIDPSVFGPIEEFKDALADTQSWVHETPPAAGSDRVFVPGEPELHHEAESRANGLELPAEIWSELVSIADEFELANELESARR